MFAFLAFLLAQVVPLVPQSEKVLLWTLIITNAVTLGTLIIKGVLDVVNRMQDRLDAESKARIQLAEGAAREQRLAEKIAENTQISKQAFETANGHNEKIAKATELAAKAIETATAKEVHATVEIKGTGEK